MSDDSKIVNAAEGVSFEAYQVIGALSDAAGLFEHPAVIRALDYFGHEEWKQPGAEILPWHIDAADRVAKLEAELAGWKRVAVEAVIPLEAMRMAGADKLHSDAIQQGIAHAITIVRRAVTGEGLPPEPPATPDPAS